MKNGHTGRWLLAGLLLIGQYCWAEPFRVSADSYFYNQNWFPLSRTEMRKAAVDTALARLTDSGLFRFTEQANEGALRLEVSLVEPAETAKITVTVELPVGSFVATASTSLRGLEWQGIFNAFEHIGTESADRMLVKLAALQISARDSPVIPESEPDAADGAALQAEYDKAQQLKRAGQFFQARILLEGIIAAAPPQSSWRELAEEELSFGLPAFEAQQLTLQLGQLIATRQQHKVGQTFERAEHLYRQIIAENREHAPRIVMAQGAIDNLRLSSDALSLALRQQAMARLARPRIELYQFFMVEGRFPQQAEAAKILGAGYRLTDYRTEGASLSGHISTPDGYQFRLFNDSTNTDVEVRIEAVH